MPLTQRDQKRVVLHARARAYEDAAREVVSLSKTGYDIEDADKLARLWWGRARELRADADSTFSSLDNDTVDDVVKRYTISLG